MVVPSQRISADAITSSKIPAGGIQTSDIADSAITTTKIADGAVTDAKLNATFLKGETAGDRMEYGRAEVSNGSSAASNETKQINFTTPFTSLKAITLGPETNLVSYISSTSSSETYITGFVITVENVPATTNVYVNWMAVGQ